ncbi:MAG: lasso peptide biosynthesis B2 protein [Paracoccaceae bacterium]
MFISLRNFLALPSRRKLLLAETALALLRAAWLVRRSPFRAYARTLGHRSPGEFVDTAHPDIPTRSLGEVRWALRRINQLAGGRFTCLMLAMAGKRVLNRRCLANTLVLGVRPDRDDGADLFGAHAWLRVGPFVMIGMEERAGHIPIASYHSDPYVR